MPQVEEERKEAEVIKEKVAKDEAAVATRQEEVIIQQYLIVEYGGVSMQHTSKYEGIIAWVQPNVSSATLRLSKLEGPTECC